MLQVIQNVTGRRPLPSCVRSHDELNCVYAHFDLCSCKVDSACRRSQSPQTVNLSKAAHVLNTHANQLMGTDL